MAWGGSAPNQTYTRTDGVRSGAAVNAQAKAAAVNNTAVLADVRENDFAAAINLLLKRDGGNQPSANLPMNGKKHTGVANASANDEYAAYGQVFKSLHAQLFTTSGTYTPTSGMKHCLVITTGGGGGSGGANCSDAFSEGSVAFGGAGAGAGTCIELFSAATIGASQTVTIGAGGIAGTADGLNDGGDGGDSSFGAFHTAGGGKGGGGVSVPDGGGASGQSGNGGLGTGGLLNLVGAPGQHLGFSEVGERIQPSGGASHWGFQPTNSFGEPDEALPGIAGSTYGVGASGAYFDETTQDVAGVPGAAGGDGVCLVLEFS